MRDHIFTVALNLFAVCGVRGSVLEARNCHENNCAREITGTDAHITPALTARLTDCSNYMTATVIPPALTAINRTIPDYATPFCSDDAEYSSVCACAGITEVTITGSPLPSSTSKPPDEIPESATSYSSTSTSDSVETASASISATSSTSSASSSSEVSSVDSSMSLTSFSTSSPSPSPSPSVSPSLNSAEEEPLPASAPLTSSSTSFRSPSSSYSVLSSPEASLSESSSLPAFSLTRDSSSRQLSTTFGTPLTGSTATSVAVPINNGCIAPRIKCGAVCVNSQTNARNCGGCGNFCLTNEVCYLGNCTSVFDIVTRCNNPSFCDKADQFGCQPGCGGSRGYCQPDVTGQGRCRSENNNPQCGDMTACAANTDCPGGFCIASCCSQPTCYYYSANSFCTNATVSLSGKRDIGQRSLGGGLPFM